MDDFKKNRKITLCICLDPGKFLNSKSVNDFGDNKSYKLLSAMNTLLATLKEGDSSKIEVSVLKMALTNPSLIDLDSDYNSDNIGGVVNMHVEKYYKDIYDMSSFPDLDPSAQIGDTGLSIVKAIDTLDDRSLYHKNLGYDNTNILVILSDGRKITNVSKDAPINKEKAIQLIKAHNLYNDFYTIPVLVADSRLSKVSDRIRELSCYRNDGRIVLVDSIETVDFSNFFMNLANSLINFSNTSNFDEFDNLFNNTDGYINILNDAKMALDSEFSSEVKEEIKEEKKTTVNSTVTKARVDYVKETKSISNEEIDEILNSL